ncbi:hypothetical protein XAC3810_90116 [Xanthomonas citri pv. citri]|uniref:Uncharacterized protein n=1 Tax=Xanthomonas citri pv. citri TaxID=611301 RepID=A0A0U5FKJ7_XANCI|nr:hypothetical protein HZS91_00276 [Xanthomonas citri pv. citri]QYF43032.1 hypothetical protein HZS93_00277 [Xanthomonas citri]QYF38260.1 hypothetical protein HZS92_00277 [Xanthomonas citri pv. citri]CEE15704.1 hypothetical protein XAC3824_110118 [Xanthomonas citri pv. citri]CEE17453.1 hypothetical protein XAC902_100118 [Xanthomonas citri pv. citri]
MGSPSKTWESRRSTSDQATAMQQALGALGVRIGMDGTYSQLPTHQLRRDDNGGSHQCQERLHWTV